MTMANYYTCVLHLIQNYVLSEYVIIFLVLRTSSFFCLNMYYVPQVSYVSICITYLEFLMSQYVLRTSSFFC